MVNKTKNKFSIDMISKTCSDSIVPTTTILNVNNGKLEAVDNQEPVSLKDDPTYDDKLKALGIV